MTTARKDKAAAPATPKAANPTALINWDELLETASVTERDSKARPTVDVPSTVLAFAQSLYDNKKRATFPVVDQDAFDAQKLMWQSAADKLVPARSATVTEKYRVDGEGDNAAKVLTHLQVSMGDRRGVKDKTKTDAVSVDTDSNV